MKKDRFIVFRNSKDTGIVVPEKMFTNYDDAFLYVSDKEDKYDDAPEDLSEDNDTRERCWYEILDYLEGLNDVSEYDGCDITLMDKEDFPDGSVAYKSKLFYLPE